MSAAAASTSAGCCNKKDPRLSVSTLTFGMHMCHSQLQQSHAAYCWQPDCQIAAQGRIIASLPLGACSRSWYVLRSEKWADTWTASAARFAGRVCKTMSCCCCCSCRSLSCCCCCCCWPQGGSYAYSVGRGPRQHRTAPGDCADVPPPGFRTGVCAR